MEKIRAGEAKGGGETQRKAEAGARGETMREGREKNMKERKKTTKSSVGKRDRKKRKGRGIGANEVQMNE